jgi:ADP-heptose:LPS heptosyltransferase
MLLPMSETSGNFSPRPIAVLVDREGLGDSLLKFPFLRAIRRGFPGRPIWWIATHQTSMAGELAPFIAGLVDRVIDHGGLTGRSREVRERLRQLPPFDLVFDSRTHIASVLLARTLLTHSGFFVCLPGYLLSDRRPPGRRTRPRNIAERMLSLAEAALGGKADWHGTLEVSPVARALAEKRMPDGPRYVGLAAGSREVRKNWPLERYIALAQALAAGGSTPAFLIGPQEREWLVRLRDAVPSALFPEAEPVDPALGVGRLEFAIALCHRLAAAVANDSGIGHLLGAVGTPLVTLFGPTDAARWAPFTSRGIVVRAQEFGGKTMDAIPVEAVLRAVERVSAAQS